MRTAWRAVLCAAAAAVLPAAAEGAQPVLTDPFPGAAAAYAVAIDGQLTWGAHLDAPRQPASLAKLLSALVLLDEGWQAEANVRVSAAAAAIEGSRIGLRHGDEVRARDLLTGMLVRSGNDACLALVEHFAGSVSSFATRMNRLAARIGMADSYFVHPCGLDAPGQRTTVRDLLKLAEAARARRAIMLRTGASSGHVRTDAGRDIRFHNSNALIGRDPSVVGLKSGYTSEAGNCLIALAQAEGHEVMLVLLGAQDRWWESTGMLARAFAQASPRPRVK